MIIDTHLHHYERGFFSPRWLDYVAYSWAFRNPPFNKDPAIVRPKIEEGLEDVGGNRLIEHMDEAGIDVGVIMMSLVIILITGFFLYFLIKNPIKSFKFLLKGTVIVMLGLVAWSALFCFLYEI